MKHHFADLLNRESDYWTIVPNAERFSFSADELIEKPDKVLVVTVTKSDSNWKQIFELPNLEELTVHQPSKEQIESIKKLRHLKRLRITHFRAKSIEFIETLVNIEELVFEYVSGFSDLSPLSKLPKLKSLHLENLRRVESFEGLAGIDTLRYLHIDGTLDWNQPIENFEFLNGLPNLEVFSLGFVKVIKEYPAFMPFVNLENIKLIKIGLATLETREYAFILEAQPKAEYGSFCKSEPWKAYYDWEEDSFLPLGKGKRSFLKEHKEAKTRCFNLEEEFKNYRQQAKEIINKSS